MGQFLSIKVGQKFDIIHRHKYLGEPTLADAILDRVLSQSSRIDLKGKSLRWKDGQTMDDMRQDIAEIISQQTSINQLVN